MVQAAKRDADRLLRVGVVGVGVMGSNHARVYADLPVSYTHLTLPTKA